MVSEQRLEILEPHVHVNASNKNGKVKSSQRYALRWRSTDVAGRRRSLQRQPSEPSEKLLFLVPHFG